MNEKVSVIVPVYNTKEYMDKAINSILKQSYKDLELILVDDGSTDGSGEKCDGYLSQDERIKVIHKKNEGLPQARKSGVENAEGKYIYFLDSDDWLEEGALSSLVFAMIESKAEICCFGYSIDYMNQHKKNQRIKVTDKKTSISNKKGVKLLHDFDSIYPYMWNKLFLASLFENVKFPLEHIMSEDYFILIQVLTHTEKICLIPDVFYHYMQPNDSMCNSGFGKTYSLAINKYYKVEEYLLKYWPEYKKEIISYRLVQELAMITAMSRNSNYEKRYIDIIKKDVKKHINILIKNKSIPLRFKLSAVSMYINYKTLIFGYKLVNKVTSTRKY